jgi:hypothetical protein
MRLLTFDKFVGSHYLFAHMHTDWKKHYIYVGVLISLWLFLLPIPIVVRSTSKRFVLG